MKNLVIGKDYWFGEQHLGKGTLVLEDKEHLEFKPIEQGCFALRSNGNIGFSKPINHDLFIEADEQPEDLHETQKKQILDYLKTGKSITKLEALKMFGCWNSGDCIFNLRKEGYNIETTMITNGEKRFASYKLIENV